MVKIQVGLKICSFHRQIQWYKSFCPTRPLLARGAKNVSKISAQLWSPRASGEFFFSVREVTNTEVFRLSRGDEVRPRGDEVRPRGDESSSFARGDQVRGTIFETFLALLARRSRVGQNEFHHRFRL